MLTCIAVMMMVPNPVMVEVSRPLSEVYVTQNYSLRSSSYCFGWFHRQFRCHTFKNVSNYTIVPEYKILKHV
jgi:hypothetical protein